MIKFVSQSIPFIQCTRLAHELNITFKKHVTPEVIYVFKFADFLVNLEILEV